MLAAIPYGSARMEARKRGVYRIGVTLPVPAILFGAVAAADLGDAG